MEDEEVQVEAVGGSSSWPVKGEGESTLLTLMEQASSEGRADQAEEYKNQLLAMIESRKAKSLQSAPATLKPGEATQAIMGPSYKLPVVKTPPPPTQEQLAEKAIEEYKKSPEEEGRYKTITEQVTQALTYAEPETTEEWVQKALEHSAKQTLPEGTAKPFVKPTLKRATELLKIHEKQGKAANQLAQDALKGEFKEEDIDAYLKERPILDGNAVIPPGDDHNIPIGNGKTQFSYSKSAGSFVNFVKLAKQLTGEEVTAMGANGAHRSHDSNIERVLADPKANLRYFMNKAGPYTRENMRRDPSPDEPVKNTLESLGRSPHISGPDGEPIAIDVAIFAGKEADRLEAIQKGRGYKPGQPDDIDPKTGKVKLYPSNEALRETPIGKFMYWNKSYYLLINGLIPVGDDNDYKTGKQITEPNTGRPEGWHIEYDRPEANRRLMEFGFMDENGVLTPQASPWGPGTTSTSGGPEGFLSEESEGDIEGVTTTWTPEERQNQLLKEAYADYEKGRATGLTRGEAIDNLVTTRSKATAHALKAIKGTFNPKTGKNEGGYEQAALAAQKEKDKSTVLAARAKEALVTKKTELQLDEDAQKAVIKQVYDGIEKDEEREYKTILDGIQDKSTAISENVPNAWRQFQFWEEVKGADGKLVGQWSGFKTGYTIAAALALIANAALTISSSMKKKGKTVPFLAWDMITQSIQMDLSSQRAAMEGRKAALNADLTAMGAWEQYFGSKRAATAQMEVEYGNYIDSELNKAELKYGKDGLVDAQNTVREVKALNAEKTAKLKMDVARIVAEEIREQTTLDIATKTGQQTEENRKLFALINAYAVTAKKAPKEKELNRDQRQYIDSASSFLSTAQEMKDLWMKSGGNENFLWKFIADIDNLDVFHLSDAHEDLVRLKVLRNTWAAALARMQGNRGALTEVEQDRGMLMIPRKDTSATGQWKMRRAYARAKLMATEAWYFLDATARNNLMRQISLLPDSEPGLAKQVQILDHLGERFGGKKKKKTAAELQGTFRAKDAKQTAKKQEEAAAPVQKGTAPGKPIR